MQDTYPRGFARLMVSALAIAALGCESTNDGTQEGAGTPQVIVPARTSPGGEPSGSATTIDGDSNVGAPGNTGMDGAGATDPPPIDEPGPGTDLANMEDGADGSGTAGTDGAGMAGSAGANTGTGGTGADDPSECAHVQMQGSDFCTIGDSWIQIPGNQVTTLEDHLAAAGVIPAGDRFDRREVSGSRLSAIINTYNRQPDNCRVLIMDGGGIDLFVAPAGDDAAVAPVVEQFESFLVQVAADGFVEHIIYSLYPVIPSTPNLNVNMKPGFSAACAASAVPCVLVDLEPLFMGQHFAGDRTHANDAGGVIIGDAWWQTMQDNCIAQ